MESCEGEKNALLDENEELKGDVEKKTEELTQCNEEIERLKKEIESLKKPAASKAQKIRHCAEETKSNY